jgi:hypothetical protein
MPLQTAIVTSSPAFSTHRQDESKDSFEFPFSVSTMSFAAARLPVLFFGWTINPAFAAAGADLISLYNVAERNLSVGRSMSCRRFSSTIFSVNGAVMKFVNVEVSYEDGTVLTDRVLLDVDSARVTLPPRLASLMEVLDGCDHMESFVADCGGTRYLVRHESGRGHFVDFSAPSRRGFAAGAMQLFSSSPAQQRLNGRYAHMLSAMALIGACFEVATTHAFNWHSLLEPVCLGVLSIVLFLVGHRCFAARCL